MSPWVLWWQSLPLNKESSLLWSMLVPKVVQKELPINSSNGRVVALLTVIEIITRGKSLWSRGSKVSELKGLSSNAMMLSSIAMSLKSTRWPVSDLGKRYRSERIWKGKEIHSLSWIRRRINIMHSESAASDTVMPNIVHYRYGRRTSYTSSVLWTELRYGWSSCIEGTCL